MEKTIEEKRAAVLAYCKEVCKGKYVDVHIPTINVGIEEKDLSYWFWTTDNEGNRAGGLMGMLSTSLHTVLENPFIERMYRLFGLQTRDAVAEEREVMQKTVDAALCMVTNDPIYVSGLESDLAKWESRTWKILGIVRKREAEQRPKTSNVLKALRECGKKLESECAKSAKLVEALEEIENVPTKMQETIDIYQESEYQLKTDSELIEKIAEFGFGELEFHTADIERLVTQSGIAFNALEAYKKGGVQG